MPRWLYRIVRVLPVVRRSEERMARTYAEIAKARMTRSESRLVSEMVQSYTRAGRRLTDIRGGR